MSASEWAAIAGAQACVVLLVVLVVVIVRLDRTTRDLREAAAEFRRDARVALGELHSAVRSADFELARVDGTRRFAKSRIERLSQSSAAGASHPR